MATQPDFVVEPQSPVPKILATICLLAYVVASVQWLGPAQPVLVQRLLGVGCALLALGTYLLYTRSKVSVEALMLRLWMAEKSDFGKSLLTQQIKPQRTVKLPLFGAVSARLLGGIAVFSLALGWWLTPLAPVRVKKPTVEAMTVPLGEEIATLVLTAPDGHTALVLPPLLPSKTRLLAVPIADNADTYGQGLKAIAERRYNQARTLLRTARNASHSDANQIDLARAQNEMYARQFAEAARLYDEVLRSKPNQPMVIIQSAAAWLHAGSLRRAEARLSQALAACASLPEHDPLRSIVLNLHAVMLTYRGNQFTEAETAYLRTRAVLDRAEGVAPSLVAASFNNQAVLYFVQSRYPNATANLLDEAERHWTQTVGQQNPIVASCLINRAAFAMASTNYTTAEGLLSAMRDVHHSLPPKDDPFVVNEMVAQAVLNIAKGQYSQARAMAEEALMMTEEAFGEDSVNSLPIVGALADACDRLGAIVKFESYSRSAATLSKNLFGSRHPFYALALCRHANALLCQERYAECEKACNEAMRIYEQSFGPKYPGIANALIVLARSEVAGERRDSAQIHLKRALKIFEEAFGERHPEIARTLGYLGSLCNTADTFSEGEALYAKAVAMDEQILGDQHPDLVPLLRGQAALLLGRNEFADAAPLLERASQIQERSLPLSHPNLRLVLAEYAAVLRKLDPPALERAKALETRVERLREEYPPESP